MVSDRNDAAVWRLSAIVLLGATMSILDTTIVNIAVATLGRELHSTVTGIQWVVTGYLLALAAVIPVTGWAANRFAARRVYLLSIVLFTVGSAVCGLATSTAELIAFRVLQGIGGGMILPIGQLMIAQAAGPKRMGRVMGVVAVPQMLAPILGPTIGGLILQNASWRWIFFVNVPIGITAVVAGLRILPKTKQAEATPLDFRGLLMMAAGLPLLTYGIAEVGNTGTFASARVIVPCIAGIALTAGFALHAVRTPRPLLDVRLYARRTFAAASGSAFFLAAAMFGAMFLLPLYWQVVRHESLVATGLLVAPQGVGAALMMPFAGKLTDRIGGGPPALLGVTVFTLATIPFGLIGAHTSVLWLSAAMFLRGLGLGLAFMPATTAALASLRRSELADATPQLNVLQRVGGSLGTALLAVVLQRAMTGAFTPAGQAAAYGTAFWASGAISALAIIPCIVLLAAERTARIARAAEAAAAPLAAAAPPAQAAAPPPAASA